MKFFNDKRVYRYRNFLSEKNNGKHLCEATLGLL